MRSLIHSLGRGLALATLVLAVIAAPTLALAAPGDNQGTGDVAGDAAALVDSNVFNLTSSGSALTLVKRAFQADGTPITTGSTVPQGMTVKFMIYINNDSSIGINDISIQDVLDTATFTYTAGSIKVDNSVANCALAACTAAEEATVFAAVDATAALTDAAAAGDVASWDTVDTIDIGDANQALNDQADIAGSAVYAVLFSVTMN